MTREEFEGQVKDFVQTCCQEYNDGARYEMDPAQEDEDPTATIIIEMNGEPDYHIPIGASEVFFGSRRVIGAGINTWEDNYLSLDTESLYAWLWLETVKRLRAARETVRS